MDSLEMEDNGSYLDSLTPNQVATIEALTKSKTFSDAAEAAGVARQTIRIWLRDPLFRRALRAAHSKMFDSMSIRLLGMADQAMTALEEILSTPTTPGSSIRRAAANDIISHSVKLHEIVGLEDRLTEIENRISLAEDS